MFTVCPYILLFKMTSLNIVLVWCQSLQVKKICDLLVWHQEVCMWKKYCTCIRLGTAVGLCAVNFDMDGSQSSS